MHRRLVISVALAVVFVTACSDDDSSSSVTDSSRGQAEASDSERTTSTPAPSLTPPSTTGPPPTQGQVPTPTFNPPPAGSPALALGESTIGRLLVERSGLTVYVFLDDEPEKSNCSGDCVSLRPPVIVEGDFEVGDGLDRSRFGAITRGDGLQQATLDGRPLYTFAGDTGPGSTRGHGTEGKWLAIGSNLRPLS